MIGVDGITKEDLVAYMYPNDEELKTAGITSVFLGYYFLWDARSQIELMQKHGFSAKKDGPVEGTYTNYENLDDNLVAVHDYMKFVKFGFGRATDHACLDVRNGRIDRREAVRLVKKYDGKFPKKAIKEFLEYFGMNRNEFNRIVNLFTNQALFMTDSKGNLIIEAGNLIKQHQNYGNGL